MSRLKSIFSLLLIYKWGCLQNKSIQSVKTVNSVQAIISFLKYIHCL